MQKAYDEYPGNMINRMFVTFQSDYEVNHGDNNYELEHMNKEFMEREGILSRKLSFTAAAVADLTYDDDEEICSCTSWI